MHKNILRVLPLVIIFIVCGCEKDKVIQDCPNCLKEMIKSPQRLGNPQKGKEYLLYGDIVDSGIPESIYRSTLGNFNPGTNELQRTGPNQNINYQFTLAANNEKINIVSPNCFQCHGGYVDGKFVLGLGNTFADFTQNQASVTPLLESIVATTFGKNSKEYRSFEPFHKAINVVGPRLITKTVGSNAADKLALILAAHRDINTLEWKDSPSFPIPEDTHPIDVPPLWNVKYKNALYSTGIGTGDFARQIMAASLLTMKDTTRAKVVDQNFTDVIAYINTLEAPVYTQKTDPSLVTKGREIYKKTCQRCHGSYDGSVQYPNLLVDQSLVQTDNTVIQFYKNNTSFINWYNNSWFAKGKGSAKLQPGDGYVAPPLSGIWASAPYFHNGSVPTLDGVIDSSKRPLIWQKSLANENYDHEKMGLKYTVKAKKEDNLTYDTQMKGHSNKGHYFGDHLSKSDKKALLEYLKTL